MDPGDISEMSLNSGIQVLSLPKLHGNSSNWVTYSECILNYFTSKGLCWHVLGTTCKLEELVERSGSFYKHNSLAPLTDDEVEKHEEIQDTYGQQQVAVCKVIYRTINKTTFLQVKNEPDVTAM